MRLTWGVLPIVDDQVRQSYFTTFLAEFNLLRVFTSINCFHRHTADYSVTSIIDATCSLTIIAGLSSIRPSTFIVGCIVSVIKKVIVAVSS